MIDFFSLNIKDVIYVNYPYEENEFIIKNRPAIVIGKEERELKVLVVKVTKTPPRDCFDYEIVEWVKANLKFQSTARASKIQYIPISDVTKKVGTLEEDDFIEVVTLVEKYVETLTE